MSWVEADLAAVDLDYLLLGTVIFVSQHLSPSFGLCSFQFPPPQQATILDPPSGCLNLASSFLKWF